MNKFNKTVITASVVLVALAISYYFAIYLPGEKSQQLLTANQLECSQLEDKVKTDYAQNTFSDGLTSYLFSSNHYNQKLQKCIVDIAYDWNFAPYASEEDVLDAVQDNILLRCRETPGNASSTENNQCSGDGKQISYSQFQTLENSYMTQ